MKKYKLINTQTKEEHLCDKIIIDGFDYYVSDEKFSYNEKVLDIKRNKIETWLHPHTTTSLWFKKVIATNNPNTDVPKVVDEVETLAESIIPNLQYKKYVKTGFIGGYNKSQETYQFSEEDMVEFGNWLNKNASRNASGTWEYFGNRFYTKTTKELFKLWKDQRPKIIYYNG